MCIACTGSRHYNCDSHFTQFCSYYISNTCTGSDAKESMKQTLAELGTFEHWPGTKMPCQGQRQYATLGSQCVGFSLFCEFRILVCLSQILKENYVSSVSVSLKIYALLPSISELVICCRLSQFQFTLIDYGVCPGVCRYFLSQSLHLRSPLEAWLSAWHGT